MYTNQTSSNQTLSLYSFITNNTIWVPGEIFGYIVQSIPTPDLIKSRAAFVCKAFYLNIHGPQGLLSYGIQYQERLLADSLFIVNKLNEEDKKLITFPLKEITNIFFKIKSKETAMLMHPFSTKILCEVFKNLINEKKLNHHAYLDRIFILLKGKTTSSQAKMNCISFFVNTWKDLTLYPDIHVALQSFSILFLRFSQVKYNEFDPYFKAKNIEWLNTSPIPAESFEYLQSSAWNIMVTDHSDWNSDWKNELMIPLVICAGLVLFSDNILPERRAEAIKILSTVASENKIHSNVLLHIARIIILLNKYTEGGIKNLKKDEIEVYMEIFITLKLRTTKLIKEKVAIIETFMPKREKKIQLPDEALVIEQPPTKKLKTEEVTMEN